jgi:hypothetical protein
MYVMQAEDYETDEESTLHFAIVSPHKEIGRQIDLNKETI